MKDPRRSWLGRRSFSNYSLASQNPGLCTGPNPRAGSYAMEIKTIPVIRDLCSVGTTMTWTSCLIA